METEESQVLDAFAGPRSQRRRRGLLPWWIKVFTWIFLILGGFGLVVFALGAFGFNSRLSIYGLESTDPHSIMGISILTILFLKWITAIGLWTERDWAINLGLLDAGFGIVLCTVMMLVVPFVTQDESFRFSLRLELLLLVPFMIKLKEIREEWEKRSAG